MSTRLVHGGRTSLPPAVIMFVTLPSIYVVNKIGLYNQNVHEEYFRKSQSIREICENVLLQTFPAIRYLGAKTITETYEKFSHFNHMFVLP